MLSYLIMAAVFSLLCYVMFKRWESYKDSIGLIAMITLGFFTAYYLYIVGYYYLEGEALKVHYNGGNGRAEITNVSGLSNLTLSCDASANATNCTRAIDGNATSEWFAANTSGNWFMVKFNHTSNLLKVGIQNSPTASQRAATVTLTFGTLEPFYQSIALFNDSAMHYYYLDVPELTNSMQITVNTAYAGATNTGIAEIEAYELPTFLSLDASDKTVIDYFANVKANNVPLTILSPLLPVIGILAGFACLVLYIQDAFFMRNKPKKGEKG